MKKIRIGIMGFGRIGRQLYRLAGTDPDVEVVAISDIGKPEILHHLLMHEFGDQREVSLEGNYLVSDTTRTRMLQADRPSEVPWDVFEVDAVIDATGHHQTRQQLNPHLNNGAPRVFLSSLPDDDLDRVIVVGVNDDEAQLEDKVVSASSATTAAMAITLKVLITQFNIDHATMTSVHAYTSDQSLQDYAADDYRRSRSGAKNIIPNSSASPRWVEEVLPALKSKTSGYTLNVPVQTGSMLDLSVVFTTPGISAEAVNNLMIEAARANPDLVAVTHDPIVSSDVRGRSQSVLFDLPGTVKAGEKMVKMLIWYESLGHARRILDLVKIYKALDNLHKGDN